MEVAPASEELAEMVVTEVKMTLDIFGRFYTDEESTLGKEDPRLDDFEDNKFAEFPDNFGVEEILIDFRKIWSKIVCDQYADYFEAQPV